MTTYARTKITDLPAPTGAAPDLLIPAAQDLGGGSYSSVRVGAPAILGKAIDPANHLYHAKGARAGNDHTAILNEWRDDCVTDGRPIVLPNLGFDWNVDETVATQGWRLVPTGSTGVQWIGVGRPRIVQNSAQAYAFHIPDGVPGILKEIDLEGPVATSKVLRVGTHGGLTDPDARQLLEIGVSVDFDLDLTGDKTTDEGLIAAAGSSFSLAGNVGGIDWRDGASGIVAGCLFKNVAGGFNATRGSTNLRMSGNRFIQMSQRGIYILSTPTLIHDGLFIDDVVFERFLAGNSSRYPIHLNSSATPGNIRNVSITRMRVRGSGEPYRTGDTASTNGTADCLAVHGVHDFLIRDMAVWGGGGEAVIAVAYGARDGAIELVRAENVKTQVLAVGAEGATCHHIRVDGLRAYGVSTDETGDHGPQPMVSIDDADDVDLDSIHHVAPDGAPDTCDGVFEFTAQASKVRIGAWSSNAAPKFSPNNVAEAGVLGGDIDLATLAGSRNATQSDGGQLMVGRSSSPVTLTFDPATAGAFREGFNVAIANKGSAALTVEFAAGTTRDGVSGAGAALSLATGEAVTLVATAANTFEVF